MRVEARIPVVGGLAYIERVQGQPETFQATLVPEPGNRYFPQAIAVLAGGEKIGYVAPEIAREYFDQLSASGPVTCPARRAARSDHDSSGVEILLDFSGV
jgi:hypothetical protein